MNANKSIERGIKMTKYKVFMYEGAICEPRGLVDVSPIYSTESYQWISDPDVVKNVIKMIEENGYRADGYLRWVGPDEDGSFHVDFGSWSTFVGIMPLGKE